MRSNQIEKPVSMKSVANDTKRCNLFKGKIKSIANNTKRCNLFRGKMKSVANKANLFYHMRNGEEKVNQTRNGEQNFKLYNQMRNGEEKFNLYRCQQKKKKKSGKGLMEPSNSNNYTAEQMDVYQPVATHFQEEILMDILNRLPVRSLLRFKCVSKFWETLISEPYFKKKHLNNAKNDQTSQKLLISPFKQKDAVFPMYCCPLSPLKRVEDVQKLDCPPTSKIGGHVTGGYAIHCCCDGLVITQVPNNVDVKRPILLLWNPSTRESIVLPDPQFPLVRASCLGLGYDSTSGDYKILKIDTMGNCPEILALKGGRWRNTDKHPLDNITNVLIGTRSLAFVHEAFHWIIIIGDCRAVRRKYSLVAFSISNEMYGEIPLPEQVLCSTHDVTFGVSVLEGLLCVYSTSAWQVNGGFKVWVLKDYGIKESWNVLFTIHDPLICHFVPKYRFPDGEVLFWFGYLQSFATAFRMSSGGPFVSWPQSGLFDAIAFTESLISPKSLTY